MKTYSLVELEEKAKEVFKFNPEAQVLHATSDGQFFLEDKKNFALNHANSNSGIEIYTISKEADKVEPKVKESNPSKK